MAIVGTCANIIITLAHTNPNPSISKNTSNVQLYLTFDLVFSPAKWYDGCNRDQLVGLCSKPTL